MHPRLLHERLVAQKQKIECSRDSYLGYVKENSELNFRGKWSGKGEILNESLSVLKHADIVDNAFRVSLQKRREKLKDLLDEERTEFEREIERSSLSDRDRRNKIAHKALELRQERELLRSEKAAECIARRFVGECVLLREASSTLSSLRCVNDRKIQQEEKHAKRVKDSLCDTFFAQIENEVSVRADTKMWADKQEKKAKSKALTHDLSIQCKEHRTRLQSELHERLKDEKEFVRILKEQEQQEREREVECKSRQRELLRKNVLYNEELKKLKLQETYNEREKEMKEMKSLGNKLKSEEKEELEKKEQRKGDALRLRKEQQQAMNKKAADESELQALWEEESERQWQRQETRRRIDNEAREKRAIESHLGRIEQIRSKRNIERAEKAMKNNLAISIQNEANEEARKKAELQMILQARKTKIRQNFRSQIEERACRDADTGNKTLEELAETYAAEEEYTKQINRALLALNAQKPDAFRNVPLLKRAQSGIPIR